MALVLGLGLHVADHALLGSWSPDTVLDTPLALAIIAAAVMMLVIARLFLSLRETASKEGQLVIGRDRFRAAFEDAPVAMVTVSLEPDKLGRYVDANPAFCELVGYSLEEITRMNTIDLTVDEDTDHTRTAMLEMAMGSVEVVEMEKRYRRKDGSTVWVQINASMTYDDNQRKYSLGHVYDISRRKGAEDELRSSEQRYREIVETTSEGVWMLDADQSTTFVNRRMAEMLGYEIEEMLGRPPRDFKPQGAPEETSTALEERSRGFGGQMERVYIRKDGSKIWTLNSMSVIRGEDGSYQGALAMVTDISERRAGDRKLQEGSRLLAEAQRLAQLGGWEWRLADDSLLLVGGDVPHLRTRGRGLRRQLRRLSRARASRGSRRHHVRAGASAGQA